MLGLSPDQGPPPEGNIDHRRCILHFDIDCFYAQVEEVLNPSLRGKPIGIKQKYLLVTCNYTARSLGVRKMESLVEAKRRCPSLVVMDGEDLTRYREASEAIFSYIAGVCGPMVQRLGMDEIFADVTEHINKNTSARNSTGNRGDADITGHLYAPGSGGTLLEAQTGLEISLNVDGAARAHRREGPTTGSPELRSAEKLASQSGGDDTSQESTKESEGGGATRDGPTATNGGGGRSSGGGGGTSSMGQACAAGPGNGDPPSDGDGGDVRGCECGCWGRLSATSAFAERVRTGLLEVVGYTCSAGIGCSKMAAKLAGELHKPHQQTTLLPEHTMSMISQLPLRKLPGCGYSTCGKIKADLGITESRQLQAAPWPLLVRAVGLKLARVLFLMCRGEDGSPVVPSVRPKTMSDEDSFKRGTVRSRHQVESHARRLATPLLLRAGERVRLHKEAPETLRFGFRRASKGYGVRVSRQCAIPSGVAAAWAAVAAGAAAESETAEAVKGTEATGTRSDAAATVTAPGGGGMSPMAPVRGEEQGQEQQRGGEQDGAAAQEALSEVVRLVMAMFDKMVSPGEELDLTLLSVGFAGFRSLGGTAQSGMARYLEPSQPSRQADWVGSSGSGGGGNHSRSAGNRSPAASNSTTPPSTTPRSTITSRESSTAAVATSNDTGTPSVASARAASPAEAAKAATPPGAPPSPSGMGADTPRAAPAAVKKRPRVLENPYQRHQPQQQRQPQHQQQQQQHHRQRQHQHQHHQQRHLHPSVNNQNGDAAASEWEGAEILVVGEGGQAVPGRGSLDWCGLCGAHVLRTDVEEHYSSTFHRRRACG